MADPGFVDAGSTQHFKFEYDQTLDAFLAVALADSLIHNAEADFSTLQAWFDGLTPGGVPFNVKIQKPRSDAFGTNDNISQISIWLGLTPVPNYYFAGYVLVAEFAEIFMVAQGSDWVPGQSHGEALSQLAASTRYPKDTAILGGPRTWLDSNNPARPDFVSTTGPSDTDPVSFGCGVLFLYYLLSQLGFSMRSVVHAHAGTLEGVYHNLTQDSGAFPAFSDLLATKFPPGTASNIGGNPFPLATPRALSARRYLASNPLNHSSFRERIASLNIGNLRAVLNSDRPVSLIA